MSAQALGWAIDQQIPGVSKLVLISLANHCDPTTGQVRFHAPQHAAEASIAERSLWRYLGALERNGFLAKDVKRASDGEQREYWLALDRDLALGWSWDAQDGERPEDVDAPRTAPDGSPVSRFRRAEQDAARSALAEAQAAEKREKVGVLENSDAHRAWVRFNRANGKPSPLIYTIIVNGQERRGFEAPTLFPPGQPVGNTETINGAHP